jgi:predicted ATP-grasp superfamily ATP-dependent carboligase
MLNSDAGVPRVADAASQLTRPLPDEPGGQASVAPRPQPAVQPPVIILGGEANALSVARDLGRTGVAVYFLVEDDACIRHSRYARNIQVPHAPDQRIEAWSAFLLGPESDDLRGAVLIACSDTAIQVLARHRSALAEKFKLDVCNVPAQLAVLDKLTTCKLGHRANIPTPAFWEVNTREQVLALEKSLIYPLMVKPRLSHIFQEKFGRKHIIVQNFAQLLGAYDSASEAGLEVLLMEWIPGPDSALCSYFTYIDQADRAHFHFTKRVIRRFPAGMGAGSYHITDWIPELVPLGLKFFREVGLRGLLNVEFKRDPRDGQYKLIECNARFTASNALVTASGFNLSLFVYRQIVGGAVQPLNSFQSGRRLIDPVRDFWAFRELRAAGEITLKQWVMSLLHRQDFAYFAWSDPLPAIARAAKPLRRLLSRKNAQQQ